MDATINLILIYFQPEGGKIKTIFKSFCRGLLDEKKSSSSDLNHDYYASENIRSTGKDSFIIILLVVTQKKFYLSSNNG